MLTFDEKLAIAKSFPELEEKKVSLGRVNFQYPESKTDKKNVIYHLHPNGNGFVYAEGISGYQVDQKGMVNIRDFSEEDLHTLIQKSIDKLSAEPKQESMNDSDVMEEIWRNEEGHTLTVIVEEDMWNVYAGIYLDGTFPSYNEAKSYLMEEGFTKQN
ncbi:hypothetical protein CYL18_10005 [Pradoshia eiseniae]|uniref:Uncharacterized protein n=1 Tax=Pradoshia eiseniae TaxID=2064768 RepID=A0A2S7MZC0_9BACI|nr:hypothetical protein [Pradoshia eiseniae]PQD95110.1 hypothetical protein CYL18_10005 [Pradoshia eiseniae]